VPVVFLHGGPGAGCKPDHRRFFDPDFYRIILFDQRGAGRSVPLAELRQNSPEYLIADLEVLRQQLNIEKWLLFGGSWGSTLGIAYGEAYPKSCLGFIFRGVFLMRPQEIEWFMNGVRQFLPESWTQFVEFLPAAERKDVLGAYHRRLTNPDPSIHMPAAKMFSATEGRMSSLLPNPQLVSTYEEDVTALGMARIEAEYMLNHTKNLGDKLLDNIYRIKHLPAIIIQGRYDLCCPPVTAYDVAKAWPLAELIIVPDAGHSTKEPGIMRALVEATQKFKQALGK
jgi:proline iminopeptidase